MPYEFSPQERIQNIMWILDELQNRLHDSDSEYKSIWEAAIRAQLLNLGRAVDNMVQESKP